MRVQQTAEFAAWLHKLKDVDGKVRILRRLDRLKAGNPGDHKSLGGDISELRLTVGSGYRIYYMQRGDTYVIILCGGDKSTQSRDIERARSLVGQP